MLKRAGRGHAADGIQGTRAGECALLCPACPQPGKNLPRDGSWRSVPREKRFLYALFLAPDANFRMKRKDVSVNTSTGSDGGSSSRLGESCTSLKLPGAAQSASSLETIDGVPVRMLESYIIVQDAFTFVYGCL